MTSQTQKAIEALFNDLEALGCSLSSNLSACILVEGPDEDLGEKLASRVRDLKSQLLPLLRCERCGSFELVDVSIHDGHSTRRDCAKCGRFVGFPRWNPQGLAKTLPSLSRIF